MRPADQPPLNIAATAGLWLTVTVLSLWRLVVAWGVPVTQDEAYYFDWARTLDWGYFDHPPAVALLGVGNALVPTSVLAARSGTVLAATMTLLVLIRLYRCSGLRGGTLLLALLVAGYSLPGLVSGVIATPDTVLGLCWALALHEALPALRGQRWRWLGVGAATGLGLLGKYTMAMIGPVLLWAILWADPKALRSPWPYLGALVAVGIFSPNLFWNAQNDWLTLRFQFAHGFSTDAGALLTTNLPVPVGAAGALQDGDAIALSLVGRLAAVIAFLGTQAVLWGFFLVPLAASTWQRAEPLRSRVSQRLDRPARALLIAASAFPLIFFAWVASFSSVEPNWPAPYLLGAAPLAALAAKPRFGWMLAAAGANLLVTTLYAAHAATGQPPLPAGAQRILRETHGYAELSRRVRELDRPVFADRYQIVAMLRFYAPTLAVTQWPGITRPSEYLRGTIAAPVSLEQVREAEGFWLITSHSVPPEIPGFVRRSGRILVDCAGSPLAERAMDERTEPCARPLHRWGLFDYEVATP